jgi:hypothetical protein
LCPRGEQCRFVQRIGEISAGKSRRALSNRAQVHLPSKPLVARVNFQNGFTPIDVRRIDHDLPVESALASTARDQGHRVGWSPRAK